MTKREKFEMSVSDDLENIKKLVVIKGREYSINDNPFHNFESATGFHKNGSSKEALWGMLVKHLVSIKDYCEDTIELSKEQLDEKTRDVIVYMLLLKNMK